MSNRAQDGSNLPSTMRPSASRHVLSPFGLHFPDGCIRTLGSSSLFHSRPQLTNVEVSQKNLRISCFGEVAGAPLSPASHGTYFGMVVCTSVVSHGAIVMRSREAEVPVSVTTVLLELGAISQPNVSRRRLSNSHDAQKEDNALSFEQDERLTCEGPSSLLTRSHCFASKICPTARAALGPQTLKCTLRQIG